MSRSTFSSSPKSLGKEALTHNCSLVHDLVRKHVKTIHTQPHSLIVFLIECMAAVINSQKYFRLGGREKIKARRIMHPYQKHFLKLSNPNTIARNAKLIRGQRGSGIILSSLIAAAVLVKKVMPPPYHHLYAVPKDSFDAFIKHKTGSFPNVKSLKVNQLNFNRGEEINPSHSGPNEAGRRRGRPARRAGRMNNSTISDLSPIRENVHESTQNDGPERSGGEDQPNRSNAEPNNSHNSSSMGQLNLSGISNEEDNNAAEDQAQLENAVEQMERVNEEQEAASWLGNRNVNVGPEHAINNTMNQGADFNNNMSDIPDIGYNHEISQRSDQNNNSHLSRQEMSDLPDIGSRHERSDANQMHTEHEPNPEQRQVFANETMTPRPKTPVHNHTRRAIDESSVFVNNSTGPVSSSNSPSTRYSEASSSSDQSIGNNVLLRLNELAEHRPPLRMASSSTPYNAARPNMNSALTPIQRVERLPSHNTSVLNPPNFNSNFARGLRLERSVAGPSAPPPPSPRPFSSQFARELMGDDRTVNAGLNSMFRNLSQLATPTRIQPSFSSSVNESLERTVTPRQLRFVASALPPPIVQPSRALSSQLKSVEAVDNSPSPPPRPRQQVEPSPVAVRTRAKRPIHTPIAQRQVKRPVKKPDRYDS